MFSWTSISRWLSISRANSSSPPRKENHPMIRESSVRIAASKALSPVREAQHSADDAGNAFPVAGFGGQLLAAGFADGIELRFAVVFRCAPDSDDPAALDQPHERGVNCALIDLQR